MSDIGHRLAEDRAMRDAAKLLFDADIAFVKADLAERSVGQRLGDRMMMGTIDIAEDAAGFAADHRAVVGTGIGLFGAYLLRNPLLAGLAALLGEEPADGEVGTRAEPDAYGEGCVQETETPAESDR